MSSVDDLFRPIVMDDLNELGVDPQVFGIMRKRLNEKYFCIRDQTEQELGRPFFTKMQMLYSPTIEQQVVPVRASFAENVTAQVRSQVISSPKIDRSAS